jgi:hypothetical protein
MSLHVKDLFIYACNSEYIVELGEQRMIAPEKMGLGLLADLGCRGEDWGLATTYNLTICDLPLVLFR